MSEPLHWAKVPEKVVECYPDTKLPPSPEEVAAQKAHAQEQERLRKQREFDRECNWSERADPPKRPT